jgi:cruciform cutting endonuclease 1
MLKPQQMKTWKSLTNAQLHRVAVLIGTPCSGTKIARISGIEEALAERINTSGRTQQAKSLSLVSIDMGIRNLAYVHFSAVSSDHINATGRYAAFAKPCLKTWKRLSISPASMNNTVAEVSQKASNSAPLKAIMTEALDHSSIRDTVKESFEPFQYATYAYNLISDIITTHKPTHILIERQRFRTGGGSAVQEWTIRVGMFESMLYAVLKTLTEERSISINVQGVLPTKVNRYWFEEGHKDTVVEPVRKLTGKEVKNAKMKMVDSMLTAAIKSQSPFEISPEAQAMVGDFTARMNGSLRKVEGRGSGLVKLDDLADCLLQGLAWIDWQNNLERAKALGIDAFDL